MKRIIYVGGIPGSGKTLLAWLLRDLAHVPCTSTDYAYYAMAPEFDAVPRDFASPKAWRKLDQMKFAESLECHYREEIAKLPESETIIIEGLHVSLEADRKIIERIVKPDEVIFIQREIDFGDWLIHKGIARSEQAWAEYAWLKSILTVPNRYIKRPKTNVYYVRNDTDRLSTSLPG